MDTRLPDTGDLWRLTMEHSPVGMAIVSLTGDILTANVALCDMLGYDPETLTSLRFHDITHPDDLARDLRLVERSLVGEIGSYRVTKRYLCADGSTLIGDLSVALLRDAGGQPIHFISQIADRTERHAFVERLEAAEEAAYDVERKARALFESVSVGLLLVDSDGTYSAYNKRQQELFAIAFPGGHSGHSGQDGFVYDAEQTRALTHDEVPCARATAGEEFDDLLIWIGEDPASRRALSVSARTVHDRTGAFTGAVLAYNDVTELIRAVNVKDEFVATVSHELRTPLTAALAILELLDESVEDRPDARQQVTTARRNMQRLSHLVADLIFSTRASSGSAMIATYRVDLVRVLQEAVEAAAVDAAGAGVQLTSEHPDALDVVADGLRLRQVLDNLVGNAILYSRPGGHVVVALTATDGAVALTVDDDGEGIAAEDVHEVFGRFYRGQNARRRQVGGTGLGLNIVRTIVEAHGGVVSLRSVAGEGTSVRVELPRRG